MLCSREESDSFLYNGPKVTPKIEIELNYALKDALTLNCSKIELMPTADERFIPSVSGLPLLTDWKVYHFHDTTGFAPMRRSEIVEDNQYLRSDAANIAPFLLRLRNHTVYKRFYDEIVSAVRLVAPFFDDFRLDIIQHGEAEKVKLSWQQRGSDFPMQPYHLSDGSIRFICLVTALLQPNPPAMIMIDEPELGLHPEAIAILAELIEDATTRTQVIIATQSPVLINYFSIDDIIIVNRKAEQSNFERLQEQDFKVWLEDYSVGDLWIKNVLHGAASYE